MNNNKQGTGATPPATPQTPQGTGVASSATPLPSQGTGATPPLPPQTPQETGATPPATPLPSQGTGTTPLATPPAAGPRYIHRAAVACTYKGAYVNAGDTITTGGKEPPPHFRFVREDTGK
jgi:hypothetical protein